VETVGLLDIHGTVQTINRDGDSKGNSRLPIADTLGGVSGQLGTEHVKRSDDRVARRNEGIQLSQSSEAAANVVDLPAGPGESEIVSTAVVGEFSAQLRKQRHAKVPALVAHAHHSGGL